LRLPSELRCPSHGLVLAEEGDALVCAQACRVPVVGEIPRFVRSDGYAEAFGRQWLSFPRTQLDSETGTPISRTRLERCLGAPLASLRGQSVLEAGCGAGRFTELLLGAGARLFACDLSRAVEANRENCRGWPEHFVCQADILDLPTADAAFDLVLCLGVIQHTPDPEATIRALAAKVKPGGRLVIDHYATPRGAARIAARFTPRALVREVLIRLPPATATSVTIAITAAILPIHRVLWRPGAAPRAARRVLRAASPVLDYYDRHPELGPARLAEWARLDTHDALTDRYKHLRDAVQIRAALESAGLSAIEVVEGGNGIEARATRSGIPNARSDT
jgi:2-polyprenyl-3-methyl-5-hydroxy-6-metoxy-1,4-benzoquinol methylase